MKPAAAALDAGYRAFFEHIAPPAWVHDSDGEIICVNEAAVVAYGYPRDRFIGLNVVDLLPHYASRSIFFQATAPGVMTTGGRFSRADKSIVDVDYSVRPIDLGGPAFVVLSVDVTERRAAEEQLVASERQLAEAQRIAHLASFEWEIDHNRVRWSDELYRIYGVKPREFAATYEAFLGRLHPDDREHVNRTILNTVHSGSSFEMEERIIRPDGEIRVLRTQGQVVGSLETGRRLIGVCHDVTDIRAAERERSMLQQRERRALLDAEHARGRLQEILERISDAFVALDADWRYTYVNKKAAQIFGRDREELIGKHIWTEFPEGVGQPFHRAYEEAMRTQQQISIEAYYPPYDKWFENRIYPSPGGVAIFFQDVTERRQQEDAFRLASERLQQAEAVSFVMVTHLADDGRWLRVPASFCQFLGYSESELLNLRYQDLTHPDDSENDARVAEILRRGEVRSFEFEKRFVRKDGGIVWAYLNVSGVYDTAGQLIQFVAYIRDISDQHAMEQQLEHLSLHDPLTNLPNRVLFHDRLEHAITHAQRSDARVALLLIELDAFKMINDSFGHSVGDSLLREVADRLRTTIRQTDTLARLGGDEFAVILESLGDDSQVQRLAEHVRKVFNDRFLVGNQPVHVTASVGVSVYPRDGHDAETLLRNADSAMYRAKEHGRNNIQLFAPEMSERFRERLTREEELHEAIEREELVTHYQPLVRRESREIIGVEALLRWQHPRRGMIGPDDFIPLAEDTRLIIPIGERVLRNACREVQRWVDGGARPLRLSVNLSAIQFQQPDLLAQIDAVLTETRFDPAQLEVEITETVAMQNVDYSMHLLRELRARGLSIAIDDFGTGQSSLIYLRRFPITTIKIDKIFVAGITTDANDAAIVRAVIVLGRDLGLTVTAEGVETREQLEMLDTLGCDVLQGYFFSRPVAGSAIETMVNESLSLER